MKLNVGFDGRVLCGRQRGMGRYAYQLITELALLAPENTYNIYINSESKLSLDYNNLQNVIIRVLDNKVMWSNSILPRAVASDHIELFHFLDNRCWMKKVCPTIVTLHDINPLYHIRYGLKNTILYAYYLTVIASKANSIITQSTSSLKAIIRLYPSLSKKTVAIYPGLPREFSVTHQNNFINREKSLLFIGGCDPNKNLLNVLGALKKAQPALGYIPTLKVVGSWKSSSYGKKIKTFIDKNCLNNHVKWLGYLSEIDLLNQYKTAKIMVFPSFREGFGFPIIEAMACGVPVLTSSVSSMVEVGGDAAFYVNPHSIDDISTAIVRIFNEKELDSKLSSQSI
jgi:glycosyltransferase involved in cell wall biosynthesis